jgi:hypothetical protein
MTLSYCTNFGRFNLKPNELTLHGEQSLVTQVCEFSDDYVLILVNRKLIKAKSEDTAIELIKHLDFNPYSLAVGDAGLYIAERYSDKIHEFDVKGLKYKKTLTLPNDEINFIQLKSPIQATKHGLWVNAIQFGKEKSEVLKKHNDFCINKDTVLAMNRYEFADIDAEHHLIGLEYSRMFDNKGKAFISFAMNHFVFQLDEETGKVLDSMNCKSDLLDNLKENKFMEGMDKYSYASNLGRYGKMVYANKVSRLFRVVLGGQKGSNTYESRDVLLQVIDWKRKKMKEYRIDNSKYYFDYIYPYKNGVLIQRSDVQKDAVFDYFSVFN